ncbi:MAG: T9SS type A sorting domain-containing protein [Bacteroidetes bacterium]|nr:T9SS type A sorting domain-containing protein [Bacteroidota bacterium]
MSGTGTLTLGSNLTVINALTLSSGTLALGTNTLTLNSNVSQTSGTITSSAAGTVSYNQSSNGQSVVSGTYGNLTFSNYNKTLPSGNVSIVGTFMPGTATAHTITGNTITFNGSLAQTVPGFTFNNLTVNNSSGLTMSGNCSIKGTLNLTNGLVSTGTNKITLGSGTGNTGSVSPAVPTSSSYIIGNFERWFAADTVSNVYFPLGSPSYYRPVNISFTTKPTTGGRLLGTEFDSDPGNANGSPLTDAGSYTLDKYSSEVYWKLTTSEITGGNYTVVLGAYGISGISSSNFSKLRVIKRTGGNSSLWTLSGGHVAAGGNNVNPNVTRSGLTGFSEFGIAGNSLDGNTLSNAPLPVTLSSFTSIVRDDNVRLAWSTSSEINNTGFGVERKTGESGWVRIGFAEAKGGLNVSANYTFEDKNLQSGKYSYRLKQTDNNGNYEYFELNGNVIVGAPSKFGLEQNYPNPFNPATTIRFNIPEQSVVALKIYDIAGRVVATLLNGKVEAGYYSIPFRADNISSGIYFYTLDAGKYKETKRMTVIK